MRIVAPWRKVTCPYCFKRFSLNETWSRSFAPNTEVEEDTRIGEFLSCPPPLMGKLVRPRARWFLSRLARRFFPAEDGDGDLKKICPNCHLNLPHATARGELSSETFAIIGDRSSGKSNYFGVLLRVLEQRYGPEVGFQIYNLESFSVRELKPVPSKVLYDERYGCLFDPDRPRAVPLTARAESNPEIRIPLIYRLQIPKPPWRRLTSPWSRIDAVDLVIFDAAGEDLEDPRMMEHFCPFILRAGGIIFVIDPFGYPGTRGLLSQELQRKLPRTDQDPAHVVSLVINMFETHGGVGARSKINIPVAFAFSKSDMLRGVTHASSPIPHDSRHEGGYNRHDGEELSLEVKEFIRQHGSAQLVEVVENRFRSHAFFAMSALGDLPTPKDQELHLQAVRPLRVADPLLWLLWKRGYLPAKKDPC